jgi:hypothetical protein
MTTNTAWTKSFDTNKFTHVVVVVHSNGVEMVASHHKTEGAAESRRQVMAKGGYAYVVDAKQGPVASFVVRPSR